MSIRSANYKDAIAHLPEASVLGNVGRVIGKDELNLDTDPPPDLVIEIDVSNQSESKFPIYAAFGVPEIWRYIAKKKLLQIYELRNNRYEEVNASKSFAVLTHDVLADFLEKSSACGQTQALSDFREWLRVSDQDRLLNKQHYDAFCKVSI